MLQSWATRAWSFISNPLNGRAATHHGTEHEGLPKTLPRCSSPQRPRPHTTEPAAWSFEFPRRCYDDEYDKIEPPGRSLQLVAIRDGSHRWHIRVVLEHGLGEASGLQARKKALMEFCGAIDFSALPLLDDTVTELFISASRNDTATRLVHSPFPDDHPFATKSGGVWVNIQEDPARVRYPSYIGTSARQIDISEVDTLEQISPAVYTARIESEGKQTYILKQVERLLYLPQDSQALKKELQVLEEAGGQGNIVRLIAAVVSRNPYGTTITSGQEAPRVLRGILLEQHPGGTLAEALETANVGAYLQRWGAQLCTAVAALHQHNVTHMDIKPSNMVLDKDKNLVLIDVGGAGGVTREWLSPKMQQILDPLSTNLRDRKENDTWAVGKVLCRMAEVREQTDEQQQHLGSVADKAMGDPRQASLSDIAADLTARTDLRVKTQSSRHSMT